MANVVFDSVTKEFPDGTIAVRSLDLVVDDGELVVLVGPSGCGKTTALRMLAGLETISQGEIRVGGRLVNDVDPSDRDIAMVFQNYALYPHMSARGNMAFPLRMLGMPRNERDERVRRVARILAIDRFLQRLPSQLSGGQRQRVAMGRALVREPQVFLMDEPLSNLDAKLRLQMRAELAEIQRHLGITTVYVTHDQVEAMTLGSRVAVLRNGILQQVATPDRIYREPSNMFVAAFIGSPPMNLLDATFTVDNGHPALQIGDQSITIDAVELEAAGSLLPWRNRSLIVGVRPEKLLPHTSIDSVQQPGPMALNRTIRAVVKFWESLGSDALIHLSLPSARPLPANLAVLAQYVEEPELAESHASDSTTIVGRYPPDTHARPGQEFVTAIARGSLSFFDPSTGHRIHPGSETSFST